MNQLSIGQLAKATQVKIETIRYYERRGLIPEPPRRESGYRIYSQAHIKRLHFIKKAKGLGFTLKEILQLLSLKVNAKDTCAEFQNMAKKKVEDIDSKIVLLLGFKDMLNKLVALCCEKKSDDECPILEYLEASSEMV